MPKIPKRKTATLPPTFLEFVIERLYGPPAYRGVNYSSWLCPFHDDRNPSFTTRPPHPKYKDRWRCWACGAWGDELDFLRQYFPNENYSERLERLQNLRAEYKALKPSLTITIPGAGSTAGMVVLRALMRAGQVDYFDLLEIVADLNCRRMFAVEIALLGRNNGDNE